jgi:hypothetical protein
MRIDRGNPPFMGLSRSLSEEKILVAIAAAHGIGSSKVLHHVLDPVQRDHSN